MRRLTAVAVGLILAACSAPEAPVNVEESNYLNYSQRDDKWTGGVKVIPVETELGTFNVWTKRVGNNPEDERLWDLEELGQNRRSIPY